MGDIGRQKPVWSVSDIGRQKPVWNVSDIGRQKPVWSPNGRHRAIDKSLFCQFDADARKLARGRRGAYSGTFPPHERRR